MPETRELYVVSGMGRDVTGLVSLVTSIISDARGNIIDLQETVLHGLFSLFLTVDLTGAKISGGQFVSKLQAVAHQSGLNISAERHRVVRRPREKRMARIVLLGPDRPGIVSAATFVLANGGANIESALMISRGELFAMQMITDFGAASSAPARVESDLAGEMEKLGIRTYFHGELFGRRERLIVFTIGGSILEDSLREDLLARSKGSRVSRGISALEGLEVGTLESVSRALRPAPESEELLWALKKMGHRVALILAAGDLLVESLAGRPYVDYVRGGRLLSRDGKLTGRMERLGEAAGKSLIRQLASEAGVKENEVIVIGDLPGADIRIQDTGIRLSLEKGALEELISGGAIAAAELPALLVAFGPSKGVKS